MTDSDTYVSISSLCEGLYKDLGSRFMAFAYPVETEQQVRDILSSVRAEYHDARHHCYAFRLGPKGELWRAGDDGEPSGSAGRQILSRIDSEGLSDILVVVVRYFGGIKLGIPGLIKAYREATSDALSKAVRTVRTAGSWYRLDFGWQSLPDVMKTVKDLELPYRDMESGESCSMEVRVRLKLETVFFERMEKLSIFKDKIVKLI